MAYISNRLSLQLYNTYGGYLVADWSNHVDHSSISFGTNEHGFESLSFVVPMTWQRAYSFYTRSPSMHIEIKVGPTIVWEGRVEDRDIVDNGLSITAFGYWRAMSDDVYTALWSDTSTKIWTVRAVASSEIPDRYAMDNNDRLYIAPRKNESFNNSVVARWQYKVPHQGERQITNISFNYEMAGDSPWTANIRDASFTAHWTLVGDGSTQTGSASISGLGDNEIYFQLYRNAGGAADYTGETGDTYIKLTNIRVTTDANVNADGIATDLISFVNGKNSSQLSNLSDLIQSPGIELYNESYADKTPAQILTYLATLGDDQTPPRRWECGVYEYKKLHFRPRGDAGKVVYIDLIDGLKLSSSLDNIYNTIYTIYKDESGQTLRTADASDSDSITKYGLTRRKAISNNTTDQTQAETHRDVALEDSKDATPRANVLIATGPYWISDVPMPRWLVRAGDTCVIRNLPPGIGDEIDKIRRFTIKRTKYSKNQLQITPEADLPLLEFLVVRESVGIA